ncbi:MAG TPA: response regulator, partial [Clostridia bacterium]|nr:response regulator [Clostridia bacterium]
MISNSVILVVDDDKNISQLIKLYLTKEGCIVHAVHDGTDAISTFHDVNPDIIILDLMLPKVDGLDVC